MAEKAQDSGFLLEARVALGNTSFLRGELAVAHGQFEEALELYDPGRHRSHAFVYGLDPGVLSLGRMGQGLWFLGYPNQAFQKARDALTLARDISHPFSLAYAGITAAGHHFLRRDVHATQQQAEATLALCTEQGFANFLGQMMIFQGWTLAEQGSYTEGIARMRQGLAACQATGAALFRPWFFTSLIYGYWKAVQTAEGLSAVTEALATVDKTGERYGEAELYRLKGELVLQSGARSLEPSTEHPALDMQSDAEACFRKAIDIARRQQAKSWKLRAATSLSRLWQQQGKKNEARQMLGEIYGWFTEGFDTVDLTEARAVLAGLGAEV